MAFFDWRTRRETDRDPLKWHVRFIEELARAMRPTVYVELGVHRAELFNRVLPFADSLVGIDIDPQAEKYIKRSPRARFFLGTTDEFAATLESDPLVIDLLFIDADHSAAAVKKDFETFFPYVKPHGLILLHDTHPGNVELTAPGWCGDAYRTVPELQLQTDHYEMVTVPISPGLTICRKRDTQLAWEEAAGTRSGEAR